MKILHKKHKCRIINYSVLVLFFVVKKRVKQGDPLLLETRRLLLETSGPLVSNNFCIVYKIFSRNADTEQKIPRFQN